MQPHLTTHEYHSFFPSFLYMLKLTHDSYFKLGWSSDWLALIFQSLKYFFKAKEM